MDYRTAIRDLPMILRRLRQCAGHKTQRAALRQIRRETGVSITPTRISEWERGRSMPAFPSILAFLAGLGYELTDLQKELELAAGEPPAPAAKKKPPRLVKAGTLARSRGKKESPAARLARQERELEEAQRWLAQYRRDNKM